MSAVEPSSLRLAVIGTPRSGNSWVRLVLARLFGLESLPVNSPAEVAWDALPPRCVLQIHWYPEPEFVATLERHGVRVVTTARHPLDVLMSWLNLETYAHLDGRCHGRGVCNECAIVGALPRSAAFLDYARGPKGQHLLNLSPAWWGRPGVLPARYEALVADPEGGFGRLAGAVGAPPRGALADVLASTSIGRLKPEQEVWQFQLWQGKPGLWRAMLPAADARALAGAVPDPFTALGYDCDPDPALDAAQADTNWLRLQLDSTRENLALERAKHRNRVRHLNAVQAQLDRAGRALVEERRAHEETRRALAGGAPPGGHAPAGGDLGPRLLKLALGTRRVASRVGRAAWARRGHAG